MKVYFFLNYIQIGIHNISYAISDNKLLKKLCKSLFKKCPAAINMYLQSEMKSAGSFKIVQ